ncbi:hypothetical protein AGMMS49593_07990 [Endomicrobiia bacterium]|nr:hypothetical protein AGMMS49593_07990 [Endomicrobiia bacterium]
MLLLGGVDADDAGDALVNLFDAEEGVDKVMASVEVVKFHDEGADEVTAVVDVEVFEDADEVTAGVAVVDGDEDVDEVTMDVGAVGVVEDVGEAKVVFGFEVEDVFDEFLDVGEWVRPGTGSIAGFGSTWGDGCASLGSISTNFDTTNLSFSFAFSLSFISFTFSGVAVLLFTRKAFFLSHELKKKTKKSKCNKCS